MWNGEGWTPRRWPTTSTRFSASTSSPSACPPTRCSGRKTTPPPPDPARWESGGRGRTGVDQPLPARAGHRGDARRRPARSRCRSGDDPDGAFSLSSLGWVCGGAQAVVEASWPSSVTRAPWWCPPIPAGNSDPAAWEDPPVPESWWPVIRASMPAFDPHLTPTAGMGAVADCVLVIPGPAAAPTPRSRSPPSAATPRRSRPATASRSSSGSVPRSGARLRPRGLVLLLGVGHDNNTSLHLAEYLADWPSKPTGSRGPPCWWTGNGVGDLRPTWTSTRATSPSSGPPSRPPVPPVAAGSVTAPAPSWAAIPRGLRRPLDDRTPALARWPAAALAEDIVGPARRPRTCSPTRP